MYGTNYAEWKSSNYYASIINALYSRNILNEDMKLIDIDYHHNS